MVIVAIIGKVVGCSLGAKAAKFNGRESFAVGVAMIPRAGVELILIKLMLDFSAENPDIISLATASSIASAILVMVIITTLITPPSLWKALKIAKHKKEV